MSDFALKQLMKYGWSEGKGLGKKEDGITEPIKAVPKFDTYGIGHNRLKDITDRWWDRAYNEVVNNLQIINNQDEVLIKKVKQKKNKKSQKEISQEKIPNAHPGFLKTEILSADGMIISTSGNSDLKDTTSEPQTWESEEEMFKICGGRTAHKAARHGFKMSGKLKRIREQEERLSANVSLLNLDQSNGEGPMIESSSKRFCIGVDEKHTNETDLSGEVNKKKKKGRKNKKHAE